jgi:hypothetical protein
MAEDMYAASRRDKNADVRSLQQLKHDADEVAGGFDTANHGRNGEAGMRWHLTASMATRDMLSGCVCGIAYECDFNVLQGERDRLRWADNASCRVRWLWVFRGFRLHLALQSRQSHALGRLDPPTHHHLFMGLYYCRLSQYNSPTQNAINLRLNNLVIPFHEWHRERFLETKLGPDIIQHAIEPLSSCWDIDTPWLRDVEIERRNLDGIIIWVSGMTVEDMSFCRSDGSGKT